MNRKWYRYNLERHKYQRIDREDIELNDILCCKIPDINGVEGYIVQDDEEVVVVTKLDEKTNVFKINGLKKILAWIRLIQQRFSITLTPSEVLEFSSTANELNYPDEDMLEINWAVLELRESVKEWLTAVEKDYSIIHNHEIQRG